MKPTLRRPNPAWIFLTLLVLAAMACNLGTPDNVDIEPTTGPREATETPEASKPTRTPKPTQEADATEEEVEPTAEPVDNGENNSGNGLTRDQRSDLIAATVQIFGLFERDGDLVIGYTGSGTIISADGLILTNAHVAEPASQGSTEYQPDALGVALVTAEDEPPVISYLAEVRAVDGFLDLAVIQLVATLDGDDLDPSDLDLTYVELGDSDEVRVGDHINIFGFPGIGGDTLTFTDGNVSGFTAEDQLGNRAWIKTDATIAGGNSGGLGAGDDGRIMGVPSRGGVGEGSNITDCRVVQDTNGDGTLDEEDTCVPIGGFINELRPINLALPLIDAASRGLDYESPYEQTGIVTTEGNGEEVFGELSWYTVNEDGELEDPVDSYPSGTTVLAATFDFAGMTDGQEWGESWTLDGEVVYAASYPWDQGEEGSYLTWVSKGDEPVDDGDYHVELFAGNPDDGTLLTEGDVTVGGEGGENNGNEEPPAEGDVQLFGFITDGDTGQPIEGAVVFVLMPGVAYDDWDGSAEDVYTYAETDEDGYYEMPDLISRDVGYTIVVGAEGYFDKFGDDLVWTDADPDEYQLDVSMTK